VTAKAKPSTDRDATVALRADVARSFVEARLDARALPAYPGELPTTLADGYAIQELAIGLYPDTIVGWKVGRIPPPLQAQALPATGVDSM